MKFFLQSLICIFSSVVLVYGEASIETAIGEKSAGVVTLPKAFHHSNEGEITLFVMPRKKDMNGPISMRITALKDLKTEKIPLEMVKKLLLTSDADGKLEEIDGKLVSSSHTQLKDPAGINWLLHHRSIYSEGIFFTMTIGTIKGREGEAQCKELLDKVDAIIASISRQKSEPKVEKKSKE